ncbi:MAG: hypothetical protein EXR11_04925 [Rhodospirillaceae bacterium]|nr:hypothetical protein [Rhodospirillaceae bacterium]
MTEAAPRKKLTRVAKGKRPKMFDDWTDDVFMSMITALTTEMLVMRDRVDTIERIAAKKGVILKAEIDAYEFDEAELAERDAARKALADRIFYLVLQQAERNKTPKQKKA